MPECGLCMSGWNNPFSLPPPGGGKGPARGIFALNNVPGAGQARIISAVLIRNAPRRFPSPVSPQMNCGVKTARRDMGHGWQILWVILKFLADQQSQVVICPGFNGNKCCREGNCTSSAVKRPFWQRLAAQPAEDTNCLWRICFRKSRMLFGAFGRCSAVKP